MTNTNKPLFYPENIPEELKKLKQWVLYRLEDDPARLKPTKRPCQIDGTLASVTNPVNWCSFEEALKAFQNGMGAGLGFVFTDKDPYSGIDLDSACYDTAMGFSEEWAKKIIKRFSSYTEYSPSRTGLHIIIKGKKSIAGSRKDKIEIYDNKRFFTFTGDIYNKTLISIHERQNELNKLCQELFSPSREENVSIPLPKGRELSDQEIDALIVQMRSAQNGQKFTILFDGNWTDNYPSQSEADQALCSILAFYTNNNYIAIDQIFRKSGLYREKWERQDYRERTITNALNLQRNQALSAFAPTVDIATEDMIPVIHINDVEYKETEFQIDQIWPTNSVGFISGQPGSCKTWFAWALAVSIASGSKFLDKYECKKGKVIAFNAEDNAALDTRRRINALAKQKGLTLTGLNFYLLDTYNLLLNEGITQQRITNTIQNERPDFIIFDPLRNVHALNEDSATDMTPLLNFLRLINRRFNCSILLVCHDKKPSNQNSGNRAAQVRGSSATMGWRDNAIYLDRDKNELIQVEIYNRGFKSIPRFYVDLVVNNDEKKNPVEAYFRITSQEQVKTEHEDKIIAKVKTIISEQEPISRNKLREIVKMNRVALLQIVNTLLELKEVKETEKGLIISSAFEI